MIRLHTLGAGRWSGLVFGFFLFLIAAPVAQAQNPSARESEQIREVLASGVPITSEMIAMAKARFRACGRICVLRDRIARSDASRRAAAIVAGVSRM